MNKELLKTLTGRQRQVYEMRTQFLGDNPKIPSLEDVGLKLGITRSRVHQIEKDIIKKLKQV